jgi:hypothetical protein
MNHALLPKISTAVLPEKYEAAKLALKACDAIDECKDWADKTAALASYARQGDDEELEKVAMRIRARAIKRCGELLREFEKSLGGRPAKTLGGTSNSFSPFKKAWTDAGMSQDQATDALNVANIPEDEFERFVESDKPPTVTALAELGKKPRSQNAKPDFLHGMTEEEFQAGMYFRGDLRDYLEATRRYSVDLIAAGSDKECRQDTLAKLKEIEAFHNKLKERLDAAVNVQKPFEIAHI